MAPRPRMGLLGVLALLVGTTVEARIPLDLVKLPPGFQIALFADHLPSARSLALSPAGTVYVGSREGSVYALVDGNHDGRADATHVIASGLDQPNGVAFVDGALYVGEVSRILRYDDIERHLEHPPPPRVVYEALPRDHAHGWKYLRLGPDGWLWFGIGAPCNICDRGDPYASLARLTTDGKHLEIWARGIRNTVGFDWQPGTHVLWFTDNGRDWLGDDRPADELNRAPRAGMHFGYPYCQQGDILDPDLGKGHRCADYQPPALKLGPHVAALGLRFYTGTMFPPEYRGAAFIAEHGSWNRSAKIGYRVSVVDVDVDRASNYRPFATGWLQPGGNVWGRPVDVLELADGSLLVSDDSQGAVYRITYRKP